MGFRLPELGTGYRVPPECARWKISTSADLT